MNRSLAKPVKIVSVSERNKTIFMKKEINWDEEILTPAEKEALENYRKNNVPVFGAPIVIESEQQLRDLGLTWEQCRTWHVGPVALFVHLTPSDEETAKFLINEFRRDHRDASRDSRCVVSNKHGRLIRCPENNCCSACPFPECKEKCGAYEISWEQLVEDGGEAEGADTSAMDSYWGEIYVSEIGKKLDRVNPIITEVFMMKIFDELTTKEIAERLGISVRNVTYYYGRAKEIVRRYMV